MCDRQQQARMNPRRCPDPDDIAPQHHDRQNLSDLRDQGVLDDCACASLAVKKILPSKRPGRPARKVIDRSVGRQPNRPAGFSDAVIKLKILVMRERFVVSPDAPEVLQLKQRMMAMID